MAKLPKPSLFSFEYVVQNVMVDPEDEQTVHWMGLESSEEAAWRQEQNGGATAFQESKEMRLRYAGMSPSWCNSQLYLLYLKGTKKSSPFMPAVLRSSIRSNSVYGAKSLSTLSPFITQPAPRQTDKSTLDLSVTLHSGSG